MKIRIKKVLFIFCLLFALFAVADLAVAATGPEVGLNYAEGTGLSAANDPRVIAANIIRIALGFLGIIAVGLIIYAGWLWMTADGEADKIEKAKKILIGAVIGLIICLASFAIASFVLSRLIGATTGGDDGSICEPVCSSGQYCCNSSCSNEPCNNIPGGGDETPCDANTLEPGCQADSSVCGSNKYCDDTSCTCKTIDLPDEGEPCLKNLLDTQCAAGQCKQGLSCSSGCICEKDNNPGEGQSCDGDTNLAGCQAVDCADNLVCSSGDNCSCVKTPLIAWVSPIDDSNTPNGAVENFITIGGRYFGATAGQVIFMGDPNNNSDDKVAVFPSQVNPLCVNFWQDNQIIVVVPAEAVSGPIKVIDSNNYYDTTDNNRGANINFLVNNITRPGLCDVNPSSGGLGDAFNLQGAAFNLSPHSVFFGNNTSFVAANNIANWTNTSVNATVPNIIDGRNSVFIQTNNINSNNLVFTVINDADANPAIEYIEPAQGPAGQYITIYGHNFKTYNAQKSSVKFYLPADPSVKINADIDFPEACRNNWWHNTYIVVKVPQVNNLGAYKVEVTNADNKISSPADFTINNETPTPGLCLLNPNNGPVGFAVAANGERFGSSQGSGSAKYSNNKDGAISGWADKKVNSNVPIGAVSGPFKIINNSGGVSNTLPFRVGKCSANSECETGEECCTGGTYWSGICRAAGTCAQGSPTACGFGWTFKTSKKEVGDPCYDDATAGSCDASKSNCGANLVCDITSCVCKKPCNSDLNSDQKTCVPENSKCADTDTPVCNLTKCVCECTKNEDCKNGETCDPNTNTCTNNTIYSCAGYGDQCNNSYFCPNSPGKCSSNTSPADTRIKCGDDACKDKELGRCQDEDGNNLCLYNANLNKCQKTADTCDLAKTKEVSEVSDINGNKVELKCDLVDNKNVWYYDSSQTCVGVYTKSIDKSKCLGGACDICSAGFICQEDNGGGICVTGTSICPASSNCDSVKNECVKPSSCECCCNKTENVAGGNPACCSGLSCGDTCGAGGNLGLCTGCTIAGNQTASNAQCNCYGTSGKFCNMAGAGGLGTCLDCTALKTTVDCNLEGAGSCCVDAKNKNVCRGGTDTVTSGYTEDNNNYCAYYKCNASGDTCDSNKVASSTAAVYNNNQCSNQCHPAPQFGNTCFKSATTTQSCDINKCIGFACINENGTGPVASACGTCCCDPSANPDTCKSLNPLLVCKPNQAPCDGVKRGLCCGCSQDSQCGDANANANGCGTDTCCQARPSVLDPTIPADGADNVCRNTLIQATFDQSMDIATFSSNVIVAGEYGTDQCPANTRYLTAAYKPSLFAKLVNWLGKLPLINKIFINQAQALTGNFCVVTGQVSGIIKGVGSNKTTDLEFRMQKVLEANKKYYVIIKGDSDVTDAIRNGVLSQAGIGMKGEGYNSESSVIFNGLTFANAKIWSFTTMGENEVNAGICPIDNVQIEPSSYLLQTDENDTKDDSPTNTTTFDTIADSDKAFVAQAYASNGQLLTATTDYSWTWTWISASPTIATAVKLAEPEPFIAVVTAQKGVADGQTKITATASLSGTTITKQGGATVYVVLCKNIWPPFSTDIDGNSIWAPWKEPTNCTVPNFGCSETNFALYYCRDSGGPGTADDLPAILSDTVVTRGSNLKCNDGTGSCVGRNKGDNCVDGSGICIIDILKEFYFFREDMPNVAGDFIVSALPQGGGAAASWNAVAGATGYKVYYGVASGNYINSVDAGTALSKEITGLTNGLKYYFALTSYNTQKAESGYSNEVMAIPNDTWAPQTPQNLSGAAGVGKAVIAWDANTDDTAIYKIYYGASVDVNGAPIYGTSVNLDKSKCSAAVGDIPGECEIIISNLTAGITYYFAAAALDLKANESNKSAKIDLTIL